MQNTRLAALFEMLAKSPTDAFLNYAVGMEHANAADYPEAISYYRKTIAIDPTYLAAYYHGAVALAANQNRHEAAQLLVQGAAAARLANDRKTLAEMALMYEEITDDDLPEPE